MNSQSSTIVQRLWKYCNVLHPDVLAEEIVASLQAALLQFENIAEELDED